MAYDDYSADQAYRLAVDQADIKNRYEEGRARKIVAEADKRELELAEQKGDLLRRSSFRDAVVMTLAVFTQTLRSLPDELERKVNLKPEQAQMVQERIDHALATLSAELQKLCK